MSKSSLAHDYLPFRRTQTICCSHLPSCRRQGKYLLHGYVVLPFVLGQLTTSSQACVHTWNFCTLRRRGASPDMNRSLRGFISNTENPGPLPSSLYRLNKASEPIFGTAEDGTGLYEMNNVGIA